MKKIKHILFGAFLVVCFINTATNAQFNNYNFKLGLNGNYLVAGNEFGGNGYLGRLFLRLQLNKTFDLELSGGYGWVEGEDYGGNDYKTTMVPAELRLMLTPFYDNVWNPYLYAGVGGNWWKLDTPPVNPAPPPDAKLDNLSFMIPVGLGTEIALSKSVIMDLTIGYNVIVDDWTNGIATNDKNKWLHDWDRYANYGISFSYAGEDCGADVDDDGLGKCEEEELGTDPYNADTDADGLNDGEEVMKYNTDPLKSDSNGDGLTDGEKVKIYDLDPNSWDYDNDALNDYDEIKTYRTDPKNPDTDGDGLNDGDEVNQYRTNPNKSDTDLDGLTDYAEVMTYHTDPLKKDTDGGSIDDGKEVNRGTDPLDPSDDVVKMSVPIVLDGITFATGSAEITPSSASVLKQALKTMQSHPDIFVEIRGYTDNTGSRSTNMNLSQRRAESVKNWLVNQGVDRSRITAKGFGPDNPIASNKTAEGRTKNRRIEFVRVK